MSDLGVFVLPWLKAFHIISAIAWMVGLLYLPRLFVYHAESGEPGTDLAQVFKTMERRLMTYIMQPAMLATWLFGGLLVLASGAQNIVGAPWFQVKFAAILGLTVCHFWLSRRRAEFLRDANTLSARTYRMVNEIPTALMAVIVIMAAVRPFS